MVPCFFSDGAGAAKRPVRRRGGGIAGRLPRGLSEEVQFDRGVYVVGGVSIGGVARSTGMPAV
jgi:hypothetical protein